MADKKRRAEDHKRSAMDMFINGDDEDIDVEPTPVWVPWALAIITWILILAIVVGFLGSK